MMQYMLPTTNYNNCNNFMIKFRNGSLCCLANISFVQSITAICMVTMTS